MCTRLSRCIPRHDGGMATKMRELLGSALTSLRYEPTEKRIRIYLDGEPQRLVPTYAVPEADVTHWSD
jgi:hypothetical protein